MNDESNEQPLSPQEMARLADETERQADRELNPDTRLVYASWGLAYLIGFGALWLSERADPVPSPSTGAVILNVCIGLAALVTVWTSITTSRGVGGPEAEYAQRWSTTFLLSFVGYGLILFGVGRADVGGDLLGLLSPVLAVFVVGMNYLSGGTHWRSSLMYPIGVALTIISGVAAIVGTPNYSLVLGIGGGGCLLAGALLLGSRTGGQTRAITRTATPLQGEA